MRIGEIPDEVTFERKLRTLDTSYRARFGDISYDVEEEIARFKVRRGELRSETYVGGGEELEDLPRAWGRSDLISSWEDCVQRGSKVTISNQSIYLFRSTVPS